MTFLNRRTVIAGAGATLVVAAGRTASAQTKPSSMTALIAAAKAEGSVVVDGPPIDGVREALVSGFQNAYGIPVSYIASGTSASGARVRAERVAGKYLLDVLISGPDTPIVTMNPAGWLDKIEPILIAPDVIDKHKWRDGHLWYADPGNTILRVSQNVFPELAINTKLVKPHELTMWKQLLEPRWQGKLVARDPTSSGAGGSLTSYFYIMFGPDFVKKLYLGQKTTLSRDPRQMMTWLSDGTYPILIGPDLTQLVTFRGLGYPVEPVFPTDGPDVLTGTWGLISLMNKAPHPSAAKLFINWFAGQSGQQAFSKATQALSFRTDLNYDGFPPYLFPRKDKKYMDTYEYKFVTEKRDPAQAKARELLGQ